MGSKPKLKQQLPAVTVQAPVAVTEQRTVPKVLVPWKPPRVVSAATRERRSQDEALSRRVEAIGGSLQRRASSAPLAAVQERILARIAAGAEAMARQTANLD